MIELKIAVSLGGNAFFENQTIGRLKSRGMLNESRGVSAGSLSRDLFHGGGMQTGRDRWGERGLK